MVANAIGAHHTDEPFNSALRLPGGRRRRDVGRAPGRPPPDATTTTSRASRTSSGITRGFRGVAEAFAVQGGREVRVYVEEDRVDDLGAVELSTEIAAEDLRRR